MTTVRSGALLSLALLLAACKPAAEAPAVSSDAAAAPAASSTPATTAGTTTPDAGTTAASDHALALLMDRLQHDKVYPDNCVSVMADDDDDGSDGGFDFAVRERHGDGCPGDPQTSPVRDRYQVGTDGRIGWYDITEGEYVDYAERGARLRKLDASRQ